MTLELTSLKTLRDTVATWRAAGDTIALVPTMGALHHGHLALVKAAHTQAKRVIVSIFVNPTQFGPNEDFSRYPRPRERDLELLAATGADAAWLPTNEEMYPQGFATIVHVANLSKRWDGEHRPGHFDGVATVVSKLLLQVMPDIACFGEKDYQQLCIIKRLATDLNLPTRILGAATLRETDGLALSSRNQYLTDEERAIAPKLYKTLTELASQLQHPQAVTPAKAGAHATPPAQSPDMDPRLRGDDSLSELIKKAKSDLIGAGFTKIDYLALCDPDTLEPLDHYQPNARLLVAAYLGKTRLIDNIKVE